MLGRANTARHRDPLILLMVTFSLVGCSAQIISHDPERAATDAIGVLRILYIQGDDTAAFEAMAPEFKRNYKPDTLKQMLDVLRTRYGRMTMLQADSYAPIPSQRAMNLFYVGRHERGTSYHRIMVVGDASGYAISGLWFAKSPYPESVLRTRFDKPVVVK